MTALEAYVGTEGGGSNATETLYCVTWFHDGVLSDIALRLDVRAARTLEGNLGPPAPSARAVVRANLPFAFVRVPVTPCQDYL